MVLSSESASWISESAAGVRSGRGQPRNPPPPDVGDGVVVAHARDRLGIPRRPLQDPLIEARGPSRSWRSRRARPRRRGSTSAAPEQQVEHDWIHRGAVDHVLADAPAQLQPERIGDGADHGGHQAGVVGVGILELPRPEQAAVRHLHQFGVDGEPPAEPGQRAGQDGGRAELPAEVHRRGDGRVAPDQTHGHHVEARKDPERGDEVVGNAAAEIVGGGVRVRHDEVGQGEPRRSPRGRRARPEEYRHGDQGGQRHQGDDREPRREPRGAPVRCRRHRGLHADPEGGPRTRRRWRSGRRARAASPRVRARSTSSGTLSRSRRTEGAASVSRLIMTACAVCPVKGGSPESIS